MRRRGLSCYALAQSNRTVRVTPVLPGRAYASKGARVDLIILPFPLTTLCELIVGHAAVLAECIRTL